MYDLLKGMRVVEGSAFVAGPSCALYLAQMGAEVIRFDNIGGGPDFERWPLAENGLSFYWEGLQKGKKSVAINLGSPEGRELAVQLATAPGPEGGIFVTNYPVEGFLSYEKLKARRGDLICMRVMGWADGTPAVDYTVAAASGIPFMTGPTEYDGPVNSMLPAWDLLTGAYGAFAILAAERKRRETGEGVEIRAPLSDVLSATMSHLGNVAEVLTTGKDRPRLGNALFGAFGRDFKTADGQRLIIIAITPRQWKGMLKVLDIAAPVAALEAEVGAEFAKDEGARFTHRDRLFPLVEKGCAARTLAALGAGLDAEGVTWGPYQTTHQAVTQDKRLFAANPIFETINQPSGHTYPAAGSAATLAGRKREPVRPGPRLGQHTNEVLANVLKMSAGEIGKLHDAGIVANAEKR
jgi:2-methylfumaryl-CoA isomerase